jgi:hypothetical protein
MPIPPSGAWLRWFAIVYGLVVFFWLSLEDITIWPAVGLGVGLSTLISVSLITSKMGGCTVPKRRLPLLLLGLGALTGAGSSVAAVTLMFFKNARHAHVFPDFPAGLMLDVLVRAPIWGLAGGLIGLSLGLVWWTLREDSNG